MAITTDIPLPVAPSEVHWTARSSVKPPPVAKWYQMRYLDVPPPPLPCIGFPEETVIKMRSLVDLAAKENRVIYAAFDDSHLGEPVTDTSEIPSGRSIFYASHASNIPSKDEIAQDMLENRRFAACRGSPESLTRLVELPFPELSEAKIKEQAEEEQWLRERAAPAVRALEERLAEQEIWHLVEPDPERKKQWAETINITRMLIIRAKRPPLLDAPERYLPRAQERVPVPGTVCYVPTYSLTLFRYELKQLEEKYKEHRTVLIKRWGKFVTVTTEEKIRETTLRNQARRLRDKIRETSPVTSFCYQEL